MVEKVQKVAPLMMFEPMACNFENTLLYLRTQIDFTRIRKYIAANLMRICSDFNSIRLQYVHDAATLGQLTEFFFLFTATSPKIVCLKQTEPGVFENYQISRWVQ